jgi:hypothetical protein
MRRSALFVVAVLGVCLAFGLSAPSAQKMGPAPTGAGPGTGGIGGIGPGFGGQRGLPAQFLGVTTQRFPLGVGALSLSRACNEEHPISRLCEWSDIFRALPPITLDTEVLAAANYDTRPSPMCLTPNGGLRCNSSIVMRPAACCGYIIPPPAPSPASIVLTPSDAQNVTACTDTFHFTATALDADGQPMEGTPLAFEFPPVVGGTAMLIGPFTPSGGLSDANGQVMTTLAFFESSCEFNCSGGKDCSAAIVAHDLGRLVFSNPVNLVDAIP